MQSEAISMRTLSGLLLCSTVVASTLCICNAEAATGDNIGINSARRVSEAVEFAIRELSTMQQRFGVDLRDTIKALQDMEQGAFQQIDKISQDRLNQVTKLTDDTIAKIAKMEDEAFDRVNGLVDCVPQVMTKAIEESLSNIKVFNLFTINYKTRADLSPFNQYKAARDEIERNLASIKDPNASVEGIVASYGEISRLARLAQCHYKGEPIGKELILQSNYYSQEAAPWLAVLRN
jgi:hypothetical protein